MVFEPFLVLLLISGLYYVTRLMPWRMRERAFWVMVALIVLVGAVGAAHTLLLHGFLGGPPLGD